MKKIIKLSLIAVFLFAVTPAISQYKTSLGLRFGLASGVTVKHFIGKHAALEGILSTRYRGAQLTGLYEHHFNLGTSGNWHGYVGGGGHIGNYYGRYYGPYYFHPEHPYYYNSFVNVGVDGVLGVEYVFSEIPLNLGLDVKPAMDFIYATPVYWGGALSARYIF